MHFRAILNKLKVLHLSLWTIQYEHDSWIIYIL
jgi:hypothetical protein